MRDITDYSNEELIRMKQGMGYRNIAHYFRISESKVYQEYSKRGILYKKVNRLKDIDDEELIQLRKDNLTYDEIGKRYGVSANTVSKEFRSRGIDIGITVRSLKGYSDIEFKELRSKYRPSKVLAEYLNVSINTLYREINRRGMTGSKIDCKDVRQLRLEGHSYEKIAEILDVSVNTVYRNK